MTNFSFEKPTYEICKKCKNKRNIALMPKCEICSEIKRKIETRKKYAK